MTAPTVGQRVLMQYTSGRYHDATIAKIVSGDECDLIVFSDGGWRNWDEPVNGYPSDWPSVVTFNVNKGTSVGEWQETPLPATTMAIIDDEATTLCTLVAAAGTSPARSLDTTYTPNGSRPTRVTVSGTWTWSISGSGTVAGSISLDSDGSSPPTTSRASASFSKTLTLGASVGIGGTEPFCLTYDVPAGDRYQLTTSGAGSFAIVTVNETAG